MVVNQRKSSLVCIPSNLNGSDWDMPTIKGDWRSVLKTKFSLRDSTPSVVEQGRIGSCVGQSGRVVLGGTEEYADIDVSAMWIYQNAKAYDEWFGEDYSGTSISGACEGLRKDGFCKEEYWPYRDTEETEWLPGAIEDAAPRRIHSYYKLDYSRIFDIMEILNGNKEPLWCSMFVNEYFFWIGPTGIVDKDLWDKSSRAGGHAMAIIGWRYINDELHWEVQNSWGDNWGDNGYCYIPHQLMKEAKISDAYYIVTNSDYAQELLEKREQEVSSSDSKFVRWFKNLCLKILNFFK